ncbi:MULTISPECIES: hypothetical protein [Flavobacterium]|uniref:Uncharacterized protein n=1 Tax=Flavobacterium jumunjinense TaxID=998845 RepID=A0ABV5GJA9_9FLAO|nr:MULTISPECIES: hypothetical protein [Flavobacterium]
MITGLLIAVVIAFGAYIYKFPPKKSTSTPTANPDKICMDYSANPMNDLAVDLVHTMVKGYQEKQLRCINTHPSTLTNNDAHSIWFDLETVKRFVYHIERTSKKTAAPYGKIIDSKDLGIRIYYATYPEAKTWESQFKDLVLFLKDPLQKQYGNLHTLVMIPTIKVENRMVDFNPLDYTTYAHGLFDMPGYVVTNTISTTQRTAALTGKSADNDPNNPSNLIGAQNHGNLIPPATSNGDEGFFIP